ncbi:MULTISPECIES: hypothetical protein [unclassified Rhizobium]|uniref:hypothetical protein n=1 Tax=unclassified Rhizobium TaxID=2613769 RepID=UPI00064714B0|nr:MULTISPECIES: hypothetical protein [unclassified Rhizobium]MBN8950302.1 hypothetical protein [Rhizobium tropici]OJY69446.1 MAG: hypothetical protein BGP09_09170 [Rhizobium sp. 60-20]
MRVLAILTMLIAWLLYGAMPALANCPVCDSAMSMPATATMSAHDGMVDMPGMAGHANIGEPKEKKPDNPCAGGMAHVASCAACLALTPALVIEGGKQIVSYPVPAPGQRLFGARPQPTAPPPRFA